MRIPLAILVVMLAIMIPLLASRTGGPGSYGPASLVAEAGDTAGFSRAEGPAPFEFPADHGPHADYQTEWWYYTGNLQSGDGQRFGYQLTFFRRALIPPTLRQERASDWAADQVYMAHFALTDVADQRYYAFERFSRGAAGLAGAEATPYRVWLEDWQVEAAPPPLAASGAGASAQERGGDAPVNSDTYRMRAAQGEVSLDLTLTDQKGPIFHGDEGYSPKGPGPGNASYYYSLTRLASSGTIQIGDNLYEVDGLSWMDHEFSTSVLTDDQLGWDWISLQLDDGSELMVFQIRKEDGSIDPFSSGTFVAPDGSTRHLHAADFEIQVEDTWRSPQTGGVYPSRWTVTVPALDLTLRIKPHLANQELNLSYSYWEGAVQAEGDRAGAAVRGNGYIEMTGYAGSMQGRL
jgi:predicted secreted hydrolase